MRSASHVLPHQDVRVRSRPAKPDDAAARERIGIAGRLEGRFSPASSMTPSVGCSNPAIIRSVVVFPDPLGPRKVTNSPRVMSMLRPSTAWLFPSYDLTTLRSRR